MTRKEFIGSSAAFAAVGRGLAAETADSDLKAFQAEIDAVKPAVFEDYLVQTPQTYDAWRKDHDYPALDRLERGFDKVVREVKSTTVTDRPAVWFVYNMGFVVKTPKTCFAIDLKHRRGHELAPDLDFALITHNHDDHYTEAFYRAMNGKAKTVISNFKDNYGALRGGTGAVGGYTRAVKTFQIKDVEIRTSLTDHNAYLVDFTTAFEIKVGDFVIYHSGDCSNVAKLEPVCPNPDLWIVHPRCGLKVDEGVAKLKPKTTVIAHLNELGHGKWRWTWADGLKEKAKAESAGGRAVMPLWGDRIA